MFKSKLEYFSGFPIILSPNAPAALKRAKLDGRRNDIYKDRRGNQIHVDGLGKDYHLYVLASRTSSMFGQNAKWDANKLEVSTTLVFNTHPDRTEVPVILSFDSSSPYGIPPQLRPNDVVEVSVEAPKAGGLPLGMQFTHADGQSVELMLSPDLFHFIKFPMGHSEITDFIVEYVGIACGKNGNSDVFKRARAHEKVVEIQGEFQQKYGNRDLFIFAYDPAYLNNVKNLPGTVITSGPVLDRLVIGGKNSLYEAMEASLISYFQPTYNIEFKDFPQSRPHWLQGDMNSLNGYMLGVDQICVTLASDSSFSPEGTWSFGRFRSPNQPPKGMHYIDIQV